ncbi:MAG: T9SS type A sorting domain-containing protein [Bacteroidota bacterium]
MKRLILLLFFFTEFFFATDLYSQWVLCTQDSVAYKSNLLAIDGNNICISASAGLFLSKDNGYSWRFIKSNCTQIIDIAISYKNIYAVCFADSIYLSKDNGLTWKSIFPEEVIQTGLDPYLIVQDKYVFYNEAFVLGYSSDDGDSWDYLGRDTCKYIFHYFELSDSLLCAISGCGLHYSSYKKFISGRQGWGLFDFISLPEYNVTKLAVNKNNIYLGTNSKNNYYGTAELLLSEDFGISWISLFKKDSIYLNNILIKDNNIFIGTSSGVYLSTDSGGNWKAVSQGFPEKSGKVLSVESLKMNDTYIFAIANNHFLYRAKLSDLGITNVVETQSKEQSFTLFPNPASNEIKFQYTLNKPDYVSIKIKDILGYEVANVMDYSAQPAGSSSYNYNCSHLSSGVYFVTMRTTDYIETKKIMVIK